MQQIASVDLHQVVSSKNILDSTETMNTDEQIKALLPEVFNGKTHKQLMDEQTARDNGLFGSNFVEGMKLPWVVQPSNLEALKTFEVRDDDVFLIAYPRSGNHWAAEIMQFVMNDGRDDFDRTFMATALEITTAPNRSMLDSATPGYKLFEAMKSPRFMGGHCPERFLPPQVFAKQAKFVYVARNPKDMLTSIFNMVNRGIKEMTSNDMDEHLWSFYCGQAPYGSWFDHVLSYWKHRDDPNFLFLKYEDLHKDLKGSIRKLAKHLGKDLSDDVIDSIVPRVTFGGMQKTYTNIENERDGAKMITRAYGNGQHLKSGKVGRWKNTFTEAQSALFDRIYQLRMQGTGLDFDFEL